MTAQLNESVQSSALVWFEKQAIQYNKALKDGRAKSCDTFEDRITGGMQLLAAIGYQVMNTREAGKYLYFEIDGLRKEVSDETNS